jgi:uncharacterized protein YceK
MRLLAVTIAAGLALTGCASTKTAAGGGAVSASAGAGSTSAAASTAAASTMPGSLSPGSPATSVVPSVRPTGSASGLCPTSLDLGQYNGPNTRVVSADLKVRWVLRCSIVPLTGTKRAVVTERSDSDPSALLKALRAPSEPKSSGVCPLIRMLVPYFALIRPDGQALVPKLPLTGCGLAQAAVVQALNHLHFEVLSKQPLP